MKPRAIYEDSKYDTPINRFYLEKKRIRRRIGRKTPNKKSYSRMRSGVERFNGWIKALRRIMVRFERLPST